MNRKQRRAQGRSNGRFDLSVGAPDRNAAKLLAEAVAHHSAGALAEAARSYGRFLALVPDHAQAQSWMGAVLMAQGKVDKAIPCFERAVALKPDVAAAYEELGRAQIAAGNLKLAISVAIRALELAETPQNKSFFAQCVRPARFTTGDARIRKLMLRALSEAWDRPRELAAACISLIKLNETVKNGVAQANAAWPRRLSATELVGASGMAALADDQLLCGLLTSDPITDVGLERLLTNLRYAVLSKAADCAIDDLDDERLIHFCCAVARQCFINDYVYVTSGAENDQALRLRDKLDHALATGASCPALWPIAVGAYIPLHTLPNAHVLLDRTWVHCLEAMLVQQIKEPTEERRMAATIPVFTAIDTDVSRAVRQQYEESPYPRWVTPGPPGPPIVLDDREPQRNFDVLVAGCGTGLSTVEFARQTRRAHVTAIDLSLASLSYAQRMAKKYDLTNVEFGQADIMKLDSFNRAFDYIDASGVLHHLADPWAGWQILLSLLRPGGVMQVGLYSASARRSVVAARRLIAERGYRPVAEDIRRLREDVMTADDGSMLNLVIQWNDFFATNECRDLAFHVQEHQITLPEIKTFIAASGVQFVGFALGPSTMARFASKFPVPAALTDLDRWHAFETEAPDTFAGMYQFRLKKPSTPMSRLRSV
ncbi:MAG: methyltransferase domain-containing protein [Xanthobacteraceae bacterium]